MLHLSLGNTQVPGPPCPLKKPFFSIAFLYVIVVVVFERSPQSGPRSGAGAERALQLCLGHQTHGVCLSCCWRGRWRRVCLKYGNSQGRSHIFFPGEVMVKSMAMECDIYSPDCL